MLWIWMAGHNHLTPTHWSDLQTKGSQHTNTEANLMTKLVSAGALETCQTQFKKLTTHFHILKFISRRTSLVVWGAAVYRAIVDPACWLNVFDLHDCSLEQGIRLRKQLMQQRYLQTNTESHDRSTKWELKLKSYLASQNEESHPCELIVEWRNCDVRVRNTCLQSTSVQFRNNESTQVLCANMPCECRKLYSCMCVAMTYSCIQSNQPQPYYQLANKLPWRMLQFS